MGSNGDGRLGLGDRVVRESNVPCLVEALEAVPIAAVSCGLAHTLALSVTGDVYSWG